MTTWRPTTTDDMLRDWSDAWQEAYCCDDINLGQPLAGVIADLQADRDRLFAALSDRGAEAVRVWDAPIIELISEPDGTHYNKCMKCGAQFVSAASHHARKPDREPFEGEGYVFLNPDSGEEYSRNHPVESGEALNAENIRQSTGFEDWLVGEIAGLKSQLAASGNYTADAEVAPTEVQFSNGRVVRLSEDRTHLVVSKALAVLPHTGDRGQG